MTATKHAFLGLLLGLCLAGCPANKSPTASDDKPAPTTPTPQKPDVPVSKTEKGKMVTIPPGGTKFDPVAQKDQIPDGAFICDMGFVHYARPDKGDGECPVCHMTLKQHKVAAVAPPDKPTDAPAQ